MVERARSKERGRKSEIELSILAMSIVIHARSTSDSSLNIDVG